MAAATCYCTSRLAAQTGPQSLAAKKAVKLKGHLQRGLNLFKTFPKLREVISFWIMSPLCMSQSPRPERDRRINNTAHSVGRAPLEVNRKLETFGVCTFEQLLFNWIGTIFRSGIHSYNTSMGQPGKFLNFPTVRARQRCYDIYLSAARESHPVRSSSCGWWNITWKIWSWCLNGLTCNISLP